MVTPDGMPLVYISRAWGQRTTARVYGPDLMAAICADSVTAGYTHFLYGATDATLTRLAERLRRRFPGIRIVGCHAPPFRPLTTEERGAVIAAINHCHPDVVWVGLSTPKQERWMADHVERLGVPVLIGVGAAFDFHAGLIPQAPPTLQRIGMEWAFRLVQEPRLQVRDAFALEFQERLAQPAAQRGSRVVAKVVVEARVDGLEQELDLELVRGLWRRLLGHFGIHTRARESSLSTSKGLAM